MSGLYQRALEIYRQTVGIRLVPRGEGGPDLEEVSPEERAKILRQINEVIARNRIRLEPGSYAVSAGRSGAGLPLLLNGIAAAVVAAGILFFSFLFNRQEEVLAAGAATVLSAESKLIEALRQESQAQLQQKDREILLFQQSLRETLEQQQRLQAETAEIIRSREQQLEAEFRQALEAERQRLSDQGLAAGVVEQRLQSFEAGKRLELETEFEAFRRQTEEQADQREAAIAGLAAEYERNLQTAQEERSRLERQLRSREAELQQQLREKAQALESDKALAIEQLSRLQERQLQEQLVRDQILGVYDAVNRQIVSGRYDSALEQLDSLRSYLDQDPAHSLAGIQKRRPVELFIISSLAELIKARSSREDAQLDSLIAAGSRINTLSETVDRANRLLAGGDPEGARALYLSALAQIPAAREGHERLTEIERSQEALKRQRIASTLAQGQNLYQSEQIQASLDRYRQALTLLLEDPSAAGRIVEQIAAISNRLKAQGAAAVVQPVSSEQLGQEQARLLQQYRDRVAALESENARLQSQNANLTEQLERLQEQQRLLQGDQTLVAARLESLQKEKEDLAAQAERLRHARDELTGQVKQLQAEEDRLSTERDRLAAEQDRAREAEAARESLRERLAALQARYRAERLSTSLSSETSPQTLAALLEAKLLVWRIIGSEPVSSQYPALYDTMERYLDTLAEQRLLEGRYAALQDMITVADAVLGSEARQVPAELWRRYSYSDQEDLLARLLDRLELVIK